MKKLTLSLTAILLITMSGIAQNFVILGSDGHLLSTDTTIFKSGPADDNPADNNKDMVKFPEVKNNSASTTAGCVNSILATPNPANEEINFNYTLTQGSSGKIIILMVTGTVISETLVQATNGNMVVSTLDIKDGLYFYYLMVDGKVCSAKKLVIRHQ